MAVILAGVGLIDLPVGRSPDRDPSRLRPGLFLYAAPALGDPRFAETIILLIEHGPKGSMGLVVNQPTEVNVSKVFEDVDEAHGSDLPVYWGGPVETQKIHALVRWSRSGSTARTVVTGVHLTADLADVRSALAGGSALRDLRAYAGYSGWGAGQLATEIRRGDWVLDHADAASVFAKDPSKLWQRVHMMLKRMQTLDPRGYSVTAARTVAPSGSATSWKPSLRQTACIAAFSAAISAVTRRRPSRRPTSSSVSRKALPSPRP
jgi:putative transcriptional regulator